MPRVDDKHEARLRACLDEWPRWSLPGLAEPPRVLQALSGGLTNRSYLLMAGDRQLVLRLNADNSAQLGVDRRQEVQAWRAAAKADLAPSLLYADPQQRYSLADYLPSREYGPRVDGAVGELVDGLVDGEWLTAVAALLRAVHRLPAVGAGLDIARRAEHYWQGIDLSDLTARLPGFGDALQSQRSRLCHFFHNVNATSLASVSQCLCHNDPVAANILNTEQGLKLIDWEYAAVGDPFFDLAVYSCHESLSDEERALLLNAYCEGAGEAERGYLNRALANYRYLDLLWSILQELDECPLQQKLSVLIDQLERGEC